MRLIVDKSLAVGCIAINTRQQRASLPFKPGVITIFSALTFAKPECDVLQPETLRGSGCNTLLHLGLAKFNTRKRMFHPLIGLNRADTA